MSKRKLSRREVLLEDAFSATVPELEEAAEIYTSALRAKRPAPKKARGLNKPKAAPAAGETGNNE